MSFKDLEQKHNLVNKVILACGKHPTDADINPLLEERLERFYEDAVIEGIAKQMHSLTNDEVKSIISNLLEDDPTPLLTLADVIQERLKELNK
jgi:DNA-binding ferritin-like protein (Dps family)